MAVDSIRGGRFKYNLKSLFLNVSMQAAVQLEAQNIQVLSFNSTCFLSPQIVIDAFILNSFPLLINPPLSSPPSVVFFKHICFRLKSQTLFNISR